MNSHSQYTHVSEKNTLLKMCSWSWITKMSLEYRLRVSLLAFYATFVYNHCSYIFYHLCLWKNLSFVVNKKDKINIYWVLIIYQSSCNIKWFVYIRYLIIIFCISTTLPILFQPLCSLNFWQINIALNKKSRIVW